MSKSPTIKIACLPIAGPENPFQQLMIGGLNEATNIEAANGAKGKLSATLFTAIKRPDFIHFDWIESFYSRRYRWLTTINIPWFFFQLLMAKKIFRSRIVCTLHNLTPHDAKAPALHHRVYKKFLKRCEWIRVFDDSTVQEAAKLFQIPVAQFRICPEGDFTTVYPDTINKSEAREHFKISASARVILFFGTLARYKGIEQLINAFKQLPKDNKLLMIAGRASDANYLQELKSIANDQVIFHPKFIERTAVQYYMHAADFIVLPFQNIENSGSAILAMGFKKLVVAPAKGVLPKRLKTQTEFLYEDQGLEPALIKALDADPGLIESKGLANYRSLQAFRWSDFGKLFN